MALKLILAECNIKVPSYDAVLRSVMKIIGCAPRVIDCCRAGCKAFVGRLRNATKCVKCGRARYEESQPGDVKVPDSVSEDSNDEPDGVPFSINMRQKVYNAGPVKKDEI